MSLLSSIPDACISANSPNPTAAIENSLEPKLGQFIQYCASLNATTIASTPSGSPYTTITATNTQSISLLDGSTTTVTFANTITLRAQKVPFHGVVFGSIFGGLAIIAFGGIYWKFLRHRHLRKSRVGRGAGDENGHEKAQLHSDCIPPKNPEEIDGHQKPQSQNCQR
ncbi:hypothetical protein BCON_0034g00610 [Botryotinia convoluta]|uniref:Uncharacterized protein n=1 Tax=Botryotinia convoluta TaxID=54673 RepID=A0A4Z1IGW1_9HELO|nr:hypothetical protein BCON_0034g00610 [Botryotinia convoluta]